jgi:peptidoglycan hydrolase FlgJ
MKIERTIPMPNAVPLEERLAKQDQQLHEASEMYEQHFMREMVKAMRSSVPDGGLVETSFGEKIFREQLDHQRVEQWSKSGGVGLADMIYDHVKERYFPAGPGAKPKSKP